MEQTQTTDTMIKELVKMINVTGLRRAVGQDYNWCKGMFNYYIKRLSELTLTEDHVVYIMNALHDHTKKALAEYHCTESSSGNLLKDMALTMLNSGLLMDIDPNDIG